MGNKYDQDILHTDMKWSMKNLKLLKREGGSCNNVHRKALVK